MNLLEAIDVSSSYGDRIALRQVSIGLSPGEFVALIGPNGSGKSTLFRAILGHIPSTGQIHWKQKKLSQWRHRDLARVVAYLPQSPRYEPGQTVLEVLRLGRAPYWGGFGLESSADEAVTLETARLLELEDLLHRPMDEMSGGQRQRVFVGRCLVQQPAALLLDEPNAYLDLRYQMELSQLLRKLADQKNLAVLIASHELNIAGAHADRLVLLRNGSVAASGTPDEVLRAEVLSPVYEVAIERLGDARHPVVVPRVTA